MSQNHGIDKMSTLIDVQETLKKSPYLTNNIKCVQILVLIDIKFQTVNANVTSHRRLNKNTNSGI